MLGVLIAGAAAIATVALMVYRRDVPLCALIAIFVAAAEQGEGFTAFQGSIFFNQDFLKLANLKLIEVILYTYAATLIVLDFLNDRRLAPSSLRLLYWLWLAWAVVLLIVQFDMRGSIDPITFRGVVFGWALSYILVSVIDRRSVMQRVILFTLALLTVNALWLMLMFALGRGDYTPRGHSPLFWDDKLLGAYTWAALIFLRFIMQPRGRKISGPTVSAYVGLVVIPVLIALSLRRNYLGQLAIGAVFILIYRAGQVRMQRFFSLALVAAVLLGIVFTAGQVLGNRVPLVGQLTEYAQLLNFSSPTAFASIPANQVHLFNVETYVSMISSSAAIQLFGRSGAPSDDFRNFNREYLSSLGLAHNGPLRAIFDFGIGGLLIWASFFYVTFATVRRCRFESLELWEQAVVTGTAAAIFASFVVTMTVVPPFFTTFKGLFFFLLMVYVVEFYGRASRIPEPGAIRARREAVAAGQPLEPGVQPTTLSPAEDRPSAV